MRVPFGKFAGYEVSELPDSYLTWLGGIELRSPLKEAVDREIATRIHRDATWRAFGVMPSAAKGVDRTTVEEVVGAGLRALAKKHHPDVGGCEEDMKRLNLGAGWIREMAANFLPEVTWSLTEEVKRRLGRKGRG